MLEEYTSSRINQVSNSCIASRIPELVRKIVDVPGCFAEFGVYNGGTTIIMSQSDPSRLILAFDTYKGIPQEDYHPEEDFGDPPGKWIPSAPPRVLFRNYPNIKPIVGRFVDTLPKQPTRLRLALVHLDCDLYESYRQVMEWMVPHLAQGAIVVVDDYESCKGCRRAVDEWMEVYGDHVAFLNEKNLSVPVFWWNRA